MFWQYFIKVEGWPCIDLDDECQAILFAEALCLGMCADTVVVRGDGTILSVFKKAELEKAIHA